MNLKVCVFGGVGKVRTLMKRNEAERPLGFIFSHILSEFMTTIYYSFL